MARKRPASAKYRGAQWFHQAANPDFNALASGGDLAATVIDRSALSGSAILRVKIVKAQLYWKDLGMTDNRHLLVAIIKDTEAFTAVSLDDISVVQDLMDSRKLLRGPWMIDVQPVTAGSVYGNRYKTITLKNLEFDNDEDLYVNFTLPIANSAFGATSQILAFNVMGSWKLAV